MASAVPALKLTGEPTPSRQPAVQATIFVEYQPGTPDFVDPAIREQYLVRLKAVQAEMSAIPGLREVTSMCLERVTYLYYKLIDMERSGLFQQQAASAMKVRFGLYEKMLSGWIKTNEELFRQARQADVNVAYKQSFLNQVVALLKEHLGPDELGTVVEELAKLSE